MSRPSLFATASRALVLGAVFSVIAIAQSDYGAISGFAKDPSGAVVPKAKVVIRNEGTGEEHPVTTNDSGYYTVPNLPPGVYGMTAEAPGFKRFESKSNKLTANAALGLDANFTVGSPTETVEVVATAEVLQTDSGSTRPTPHPGPGRSALRSVAQVISPPMCPNRPPAPLICNQVSATRFTSPVSRIGTSPC